MCLSGCLYVPCGSDIQGSTQGGIMCWKLEGDSESIMTKVDLAEWKTKGEAAAMLECSKKTIERMAGRREIEKRDRRIAGRKPLPVYNPQDIERLQGLNAVVEGFPVKAGNGGNALVKRSGERTASTLL